MRFALLLSMLASLALGQARPPSASDYLAAHLDGTETFTGAKTFAASLRTTAGQKLTFDGATEAKYLSSNGTTLTLTGLTFTSATQGSTIAGLTASGYLESTAILYVRGQFNYITNDNGTDPLRLYDNDAVCVGDTTGTDCDGTLKAGTVTAGDLKALVVHGTGTSQQAIETASGSFAAAAAVISFTTAFAATPVCTCTATTVLVPCSFTTGPSTTGVTLAGTGTDGYNLICVGRK